MVSEKRGYKKIKQVEQECREKLTKQRVTARRKMSNMQRKSLEQSREEEKNNREGKKRKEQRRRQDLGTLRMPPSKE
ncbi:hypothetical protein AMTR_s00070p00078410 [Amborella trichopoda]|uniref:Uncharacterized protein n=1 Tax=Amborella trichopoda TaxID=13333 RepID=U5DGI3_AMBTC|nr:hypothetical protein AMTR_s00070p00078410 [Amborella trichopoda]